MGTVIGLVGAIFCGVLAGGAYVALETQVFDDAAPAAPAGDDPGAAPGPQVTWTSHVPRPSRPLGSAAHTPRVDFDWSEKVADTVYLGRSAALIQLAEFQGRTEVCGVMAEAPGHKADRVARWMKTATLRIADIALPASFAATPLVSGPVTFGGVTFGSGGPKTAPARCVLTGMPWDLKYIHALVTISGPRAVVQ